MSFHEQELCPSTSLDENFKQFEFQTDWSYYVDLRQSILALKLKFFKGRAYELYNSKEVEKEHKEEAKADEETGEEEEAPVL